MVGRKGEFRDNVDVVVDICEQLGYTAFDALYGKSMWGQRPEDQGDLAMENPLLASRAVVRLGGTVLSEAVSSARDYPLLTAGDAVGVCDRLAQHGASNVGFLADFYHLAVNGEDLGELVERYAERIAHVQIADAPGRHEPGTGNLDLARPPSVVNHEGLALSVDR